MIEKDLLERLSKELQINDLELIEKDLLLQGLLLELSNSQHFFENYCFKGGTCLTKAYFGYYRFSEDLDFTWIHQQKFAHLSIKQTQKKISEEINRLLELFSTIAKKLDLDFKPQKHDPHYVNLAGRNRFATFKFWYASTSEAKPTFVKIQLNLLETLVHPPKKHIIKAIAEKLKEEIEYLYPNQGKLATQNTRFFVYDLQEIAAEKIRATLTRKGFKSRDMVDLYYLSKHGTTIERAKELAIKKIVFMNKYEKYKKNLLTKQLPENYEMENETSLLIQPLPKDFNAFSKKAIQELNALLAKTKKNSVTEK